MKHPCARTILFLTCTAMGALSACSTTPSESTLHDSTAPVVAPQTFVALAADAQSQHYYVFGEVAAQGAQPFDADMTIFEAVTRAQPRKDSANLGRVRLIRADPRDPYERTIDLQHIIETGDSTQNLHVQDRDVIYVPATEPVEPKR